MTFNNYLFTGFELALLSDCVLLSVFTVQRQTKLHNCITILCSVNLILTESNS